MRRTIIIWLGAISLVLAACGGAADDGTTTTGAAAPATTSGEPGDTTATTSGSGAPTGDPIVFGSSLPLTGGFSIPGSLHEEGYQVCVDIINERGGLLGRPVELLVSDNQSDPETTASQTDRFINVDNVDVLLGTFSTLLSFPASAIAEQAGMLYPEPSDSSLQSHSRGFQNNFGFTLKPINYIGQSPVDVLNYYREQGIISDEDFPANAAVIYFDDFFTNSIAQGLVGGTLEIPGSDDVVDFGDGYLNEVGIELVFEEQYPEGFTDWVGLANRVKNSGAEMLFALTLPPQEFDVVRAMQTVDYQPTGAFFSQGTYLEFEEQLGDAANGIMVWSTWDPTIEWEGELAGQPFNNADFAREIEARTGQPANEDHAQPFTVCQAVAQAIAETGSTDNAGLVEWFASRTAEDPARTVQGDLYWDDLGLLADRDVLLLQWQSNELNFVFPRGDAYSTAIDLEWPKPEW
jgi:branched-chain amino acid transport system substrate-binding protein